MHHAKNKTIVLCLPDVVSYNNITQSALHKHEWSDEKGRVTEQRTVKVV